MFNLAIETSGRLGSVTLGRGDELLQNIDMPEQQRHTVDLVPTIDQLFRAHRAKPKDLAEVYISIGPGSFTGLRIGVATVKMLAQTLGVKVVAVPTLDAVAMNYPAENPKAKGHGPYLAVCVNLKAQTAYSGLFEPGPHGWKRMTEPALRTMAELLDTSPRPLTILGDPLPKPPPGGFGHGVEVLPGAMAVARSEAVWTLGRAMAKRGEYVDAESLLPLYARVPEAVELWKQRHG